MKIEAIRKTASHWIDENGDHIVESPLCPMVAGVGDTEEDARQIFEEMLEEHIADVQAGRVATGRGRPAKGKKKFATEVDPDIAAAIAAAAKELGISQGELVEGAYRLFQRNVLGQS